MLEERAWGERRGRAPLREQTGVRGEEKKAAGEGCVQGCEETQTPSAGTPRPPSTDGSSEFKAECSVRETEARGGPQAPVSPQRGGDHWPRVQPTKGCGGGVSPSGRGFLARAGEGPSGARAGGLGPRHSACFQLPGSARPLGLCPTFCAVSNEQCAGEGSAKSSVEVSASGLRRSAPRAPGRQPVRCPTRGGAVGGAEGRDFGRGIRGGAKGRSGQRTWQGDGRGRRGAEQAGVGARGAGQRDKDGTRRVQGTRVPEQTRPPGSCTLGALGL